MNIKNKLAVKLLLQMIAVIILISFGFYVIRTMQAREMQERIHDKAQLYSFILGSNLDKIVGDNLKALKELQEATVNIARDNPAIEQMHIISPDAVILSSSNLERIWESPEVQYQTFVEESVNSGQTKSIVQKTSGHELIIHFLPLVHGAEESNQIIGVLQVNVKFSVQQNQISSSLRSNQAAYYRQEASVFAGKLADKLQTYIFEAQRNFEYLERLVENMILDEDIVNITLYSKELGALISAQEAHSPKFLIQSLTHLQTQAMNQNQTILANNKGDNLLVVASPLYLGKLDDKKVGGAVQMEFSLDHIQSLINKDRNNIIVMNLAITLTICLLIGLFFRGKILNPINELILLTQEIKKDNLTKRSANKSQDEIGQLAEAFNSMLDQLEKSKEEIKKWNVELQDRVDHVTKELQEKQSQLLKSEKLASMGVLASGIAHEINNPIGIILGNAQMLSKEIKSKKKKLDLKEAEEILQSIEEYSKRCSHIVTSLLQFTKNRDIHLVQTNLAKSIDNALLFTKGRLEKKDIEVVDQCSSLALSVLADPIQLEQVFINILINAEQSIKSKGKIKISAKETKDTLSVSVEDSGEGVKQENIKKVFDPFFSTKDPGEGVGLGLSISYGIIKAHGGDIEIKSGVKNGTTITVKLPKAKKG